uniref:Uncharacterized protein n=1 Tax=Rhizophora mucronata TaxID=61149 RepID=A0A2P2KDT9_RHIMU
MISVAHMDSTKIVDIGITQMLSLVTSYDSDANLDVSFQTFPQSFITLFMTLVMFKCPSRN